MSWMALSATLKDLSATSKSRENTDFNFACSTFYIVKQTAYLKFLLECQDLTFNELYSIFGL